MLAGVGGARDEDLVGAAGQPGPRSGRPGRGGAGPFGWVSADLGYGERPASVWRAWPSARVARRRPGERRRARRRSGLADDEKNFSFRGCTRRPMGHPPGPTTCTAVRGAPPLHEKGVSPQRTTKRQGKEISLLATLNV